MGELINKLRDQAVAWFNSMDQRRRILVIGGAVGFVLVVAVLLIMVTRPNYVAINRGLTAQQAAGITAKLEEENIPWKSEDNATTVLVPQNQVDQARMALSLANLTSNDGFTYDDVWAQISFTQTTEEKNKMFLIAQQTSIANSLKFIESIDEAKVILNVKESSSFLNLEEDVSSASVYINVNPNNQLNDSQVKSIVNFVTTAVKGLTPDKITIIDQTGMQLNNYELSSEQGSSSKQDELKVEVEQRLDKNIKEFLAQIYGDKNVNVMTSVTLDFDSQTTNTIQFSTPVEGAEDGLLRSVASLKENVVNNASGGVAGTDTNTTETPNFTTTDSGSSDYTKSQETLNYELNEVQQTIVKSEGQISGISIAVIINKTALVDSELSDEDKLRLTNLVSAAAGFDDTKYVEVFTGDFQVEAVVPLTPDVATLFNIPIWIFAVVLGIFAVAGLVTFLMIRRRASNLKAAQEIIEEREEFEEIDTEFQDRSSPKYQIEKFIDSKPEAVAQLLRSWLSED
ncbi:MULTISPECIES: flagellar basal-body MS-ring/collar protein FliF [unclassified Fusibacter]|uniref:flagellar basal-body MS-ring/collar protein FliF n=1 Tax=unclassified Fusibacter TaxID=2624464 RepID=UPI0010109B4E|nr:MULTISPECIES: flagellar basal-body MS-ring/collar protein FliF [unclassified Fusibacter]MCK8058754.1 flagellar M-ring protein FliF [Fusibacter sp. A2]NPE21828.1 flagellar M-ring protein FliF [Fusibacter sp. A1]RXV61400.1 flagellar M-ring protein FliF [Fusibacter sp. A1]